MTSGIGCIFHIGHRPSLAASCCFVEGWTVKRRVLVALLATVSTGAIGAVAAPVRAAPRATCTYQRSFLPTTTPVNGDMDRVRNASRAGDVYAGTRLFTSNDAVLWKDGTATNLGTFPGATDWLESEDVNGSGTVVGWGRIVTKEEIEETYYEFFPFRSRNGVLEQLPVPAGLKDVKAMLVDEAGNIYGQHQEPYGGFSNYPNRIFKWPADRPGTVEVLTGFPTDREPVLRDIDADGSLVYDAGLGGNTTTPDSPYAYIWRNGVSTRLAAGNSTAQSVRGIANGRTYGMVRDSARVYHGAVWDADGTLHRLTGADNVEVSDVNSAGLYLIWNFTTRKASLWQGISRLVEFSTSESPIAVTADGSLVGAAPQTAGGWSFPAIWRCA
jgi:hypothetical protein